MVLSISSLFVFSLCERKNEQQKEDMVLPVVSVRPEGTRVFALYERKNRNTKEDKVPPLPAAELNHTLRMQRTSSQE
jgi:hypothetical protein